MLVKNISKNIYFSLKFSKFNYKKMNKLHYNNEEYNINNYIKELKEYFTNIINNNFQEEKIENKKELFLILGNKSCDMDSFISSFSLSLIRNLYQNNAIPTEINLKNLNKIYIPILNCKKEDFNDRLDISHLCLKNKIKYENFIFWDDEVLLKFFSKSEKKGKKFSNKNYFI